MIKDIFNSLRAQGVFVGQLFGARDSWSNNDTMTFCTTDHVHQLLEGIDVIRLQEQEYEGTTALGNHKHWHVYEILGRRI